MVVKTKCKLSTRGFLKGKEYKYEFKGKKFSDTERLYTGGDYLSSGSGSRSERKEEKWCSD